MQEYYNSAIDMWSVGCIFAELLQTLSDTRSQPLFPGRSCFPLSAPKNEKMHDELFEEEFQSETHQLAKIFSIIGCPSKEDIESLDDGPMKEYLLSLPPEDAMDFNYLFPDASQEAIELLKRMLVFNPKKRITVKDALASSFFKNIRNVDKEITVQEKISLPFEYSSVNSDMESYRLRRLIFHETVEFNNLKEKKERIKKDRSKTISVSSIPHHKYTNSDSRLSRQNDKKDCCIM